MHDLAEKAYDGGWRTLRVPDWRLEGWGYLELNIKDDVGGC